MHFTTIFIRKLGTVMCGMNHGTDVLHCHSCCPGDQIPPPQEWMRSLFIQRSLQYFDTEREREINITLFRGQYRMHISIINTFIFSSGHHLCILNYVKASIIQRCIGFRDYTYLDDLLLHELNLMNLFIDRTEFLLYVMSFCTFSNGL